MALPKLSEAEEAAWAEESAATGNVSDDTEIELIAERDPAAAEAVVEHLDDGDADTEEELKWRQERKVPFKAFDAQRHRIKTTEAEKAQLATELALYKERMEAINYAFSQRQKAEPQPGQQAPPPPMSLKDRTEQLKQKAQNESIWDAFEGALDMINEVAGTTSQVQQTIAEQAQRQSFVQTVLEAEQQARGIVEDYDDAVRFARGARIAELKYHGLNDRQAEAQLDKEVEAFLKDAMAKGRHPAQAVYEYSKVRGYQPKAGTPEGQAPARNAQGQFVGTNAPPNKQIEQMADSQKRHKSLSSTNGASGGADRASEITPEKVLAMSRKEFEAWVAADKDGSKFEKLMVG